MVRTSIAALVFALTMVMGSTTAPVALGDSPKYAAHDPILIEDVRGTAGNPYVIEGYDISASSGNCIELRDCAHVVIRNNRLHDCEVSRDQTDYGIDTTDHDNDNRGFALLVGDSEDIVIEDNVCEYNKQSILVYRSENVRILDNEVRNTIWWRPIALEKCEDVEIAGNHLEDNGVPGWFWAPGKRAIGIFCQQSSGLSIHDNTIIRSSSDGIMIMGNVYAGSYTSREDDWTTRASDIDVRNNLVLDNMEIGIAAMCVRQLTVADNTVRQGAIVLDVDTRDSEVCGNAVTMMKKPGAITLGISHDNWVHDNIMYTIDTDLDDSWVVGFLDDPSFQMDKAEWAGIPYQPSSNNTLDNNRCLYLGEELGEAIAAKMVVDEREGYWIPKGWFSCETDEGVVDEQCVERERARGNQGIPREWLVFEPLMPDSSLYVIDPLPDGASGDEDPTPEPLDNKKDQPDETAATVSPSEEPTGDDAGASEDGLIAWLDSHWPVVVAAFGGCVIGILGTVAVLSRRWRNSGW